MKKIRIILLVFALLFVGQTVLSTTMPVQAAAASRKKSGLKKEKGKYYYYKKGKKVKKKWVTIKRKKYYFAKSGAAAIGWTKISGKAYYFNNRGVMVKNKTVAGIKLNRKGYASLKNQRVKLQFKVLETLKKQTRTRQSKAQKLRSCYNYVSKFRYLPRRYSVAKKGWERTYALDALTNKKGNCYSYSSAFAMLARELGYDAKIVTGTVIKNGNQPIVHAWVEIDGKVYDPQSENNMKEDLFGKDYNQTNAIKYTVGKKI